MKNWLLLDNQSTMDIFCNFNVLKNVRRMSDILYLETNSGTLKTNQKRVLQNYGEVWYSKEAMTNILSLKNVIKKYKVSYNSMAGNQFVVHKPDGRDLIFKQSSNGLFYHDLSKREVCLMETVAENREYFSDRAYKRALEARKLYHIVGTPSVNNFKAIIKGIQLKIVQLL